MTCWGDKIRFTPDSRSYPRPKHLEGYLDIEGQGILNYTSLVPPYLLFTFLLLGRIRSLMIRVSLSTSLIVVFIANWSPSLQTSLWLPLLSCAELFSMVYKFSFEALPRSTMVRHNLYLTLYHSSSHISEDASQVPVALSRHHHVRLGGLGGSAQEGRS